MTNNGHKLAINPNRNFPWTEFCCCTDYCQSTFEQLLLLAIPILLLALKSSIV